MTVQRLFLWLYLCVFVCLCTCCCSCALLVALVSFLKFPVYGRGTEFLSPIAHLCKQHATQAHPAYAQQLACPPCSGASQAYANVILTQHTPYGQ
jgi:hypothetical protein